MPIKETELEIGMVLGDMHNGLADVISNLENGYMSNHVIIPTKHATEMLHLLLKEALDTEFVLTGNKLVYLIGESASGYRAAYSYDRVFGIITFNFNYTFVKGN